MNDVLAIGAYGSPIMKVSRWMFIDSGYVIDIRLGINSMGGPLVYIDDIKSYIDYQFSEEISEIRNLKIESIIYD